MDELIKLVAKKTGLSEQMAKIAVDTVIGFLKKKLPAPVASQIDGVLAGTSSVEGLKDLSKGLEGILGGKGSKKK